MLGFSSGSGLRAPSIWSKVNEYICTENWDYCSMLFVLDYYFTLSQSVCKSHCVSKKVAASFTSDVVYMHYDSEKYSLNYDKILKILIVIHDLASKKLNRDTWVLQRERIDMQ